MSSNAYHIVERKVNGKIEHGAWILGKWYQAELVANVWIIKNINQILMEYFYAEISRKFNIKIIHGAWINGVWNPANFVNGKWQITDLEKLQKLLRMSNKTLEQMYRKESESHLQIEERLVNGQQEHGSWIKHKWYPAKFVDGKWVIEQIELNKDKTVVKKELPKIKIIERIENGKKVKGAWIAGKWYHATLKNSHWVVDNYEKLVAPQKDAAESLDKFMGSYKY